MFPSLLLRAFLKRYFHGFALEFSVGVESGSTLRVFDGFDQPSFRRTGDPHTFQLLIGWACYTSPLPADPRPNSHRIMNVLG